MCFGGVIRVRPRLLDTLGPISLHALAKLVIWAVLDEPNADRSIDTQNAGASR